MKTAKPQVDFQKGSGMGQSQPPFYVFVLGSSSLMVAVALLLCGVLVLGLGCTCFSTYR